MTRVAVEPGVELACRTAGSGPTLLFHPGFSLTLDLWNSTVAELASTHRCVTFDPRGHGSSDKPDSEYTVAELARDVMALVERLELREVTLVGHSLGGAACLEAVLDHDDAHRVSGLMLLAPAVPRLVRAGDGEFGAPADAITGLGQAMRADFVGTQLGSAAALFHRTPPETVRWLLEKTLDMPVHIAARLFGRLPHLEYADRLAEVKVPSLVVWGRQDQIGDPRWLGWFGEHVPDWRTAELAESGHCPMTDQPGELAELLRGFAGS